jgi:GT2 family glycosyltransferase
MVRNEADIMPVFLRQAIELFDRFVFIDVLSTDGTSELLREAASRDERIVIYKCRTKEKYQSAMMNALAREAVREGADWLFFLDADEFVSIESRNELEDYLRAFGSEVMSMPWINLVPSEYVDFTSFDSQQEFRWSGRASIFCKVAVSSLFFHTNPNAYINEGNHTISANNDGSFVQQHFGIPLLHVPVRSRERLIYKLTNAVRFLGSKHNTVTGEGHHVSSILNVIAGAGTSNERLNAVAANYGQPDGGLEAIEPAKLGWPVKLLPRYLALREGGPPPSLSLGATLAADTKVAWLDLAYLKNSAITAAVDDDELHIVAQPISGRLQPRYGRFEELPPVLDPPLPPSPNFVPKLLADALATSLLPIKFATDSAWSELVPVLFAIFALVRPRRYVELGVHNGMSFFAACQVSEYAQTNTECVAVDSWVGDRHASFYSLDVFDTFKRTLSRYYPDAFFIHGMFAHSLNCFQNGSVDLLHIDGYHTYQAVKEDFDSWLCKLSDLGVIMFHDINVHEKNFGVWQFWEELCRRYIGLSFMHCHGLGLLYVGRQDSAIAEGFRWLRNNPAYFSVLQRYFEVLGEYSVDYKKKSDDARRFRALVTQRGGESSEGGGVRFNDKSADEIENARALDRDRLTQQLSSSDELILIPINGELGNAADHAVVITKALNRLSRGLSVRRVLLWPFQASRRRYRRQMKITKYLRKTIRSV